MENKIFVMTQVEEVLAVSLLTLSCRKVKKEPHLMVYAMSNELPTLGTKAGLVTTRA